MARAGDRGADLPGAEQARQVLAGFRGRLYRCLMLTITKFPSQGPAAIR
jgi:hypothetical protein